MRIQNLYFAKLLDSAGELDIEIECRLCKEDYPTFSTWIDKEQALKIIAHLQEVFSL